MDPLALPLAIQVLYSIVYSRDLCMYHCWSILWCIPFDPGCESGNEFLSFSFLAILSVFSFLLDQTGEQMIEAVALA